MQIKQINNKNYGFLRFREDLGVDENGNLAQGYQHHDALWWPNSPSFKYLNAKMISDVMPLLQHTFMVLANNIVKHWQPKFVLDLGSGSGELCKNIRNLDPNIITVTVDANKEVINSPYIDNNHFVARTDQPLDFRDIHDNKVMFDLIISLEHFEHVPENSFDILMDNVINHSTVGTRLIATAATFLYSEDKQHIHCNIKTLDEWFLYLYKFNFKQFYSPFGLGRGGNEIFVTQGHTRI